MSIAGDGRLTATSTHAGKTCTVAGPSGSCDVSGLTASTAYTLTVAATNAIGDSVASTASAPITLHVVGYTGLLGARCSPSP